MIDEEIKIITVKIKTLILLKIYVILIVIMNVGIAKNVTVFALNMS